MCKRGAWVAAAAVVLASCAGLPLADQGSRTLFVVSVRTGQSSYSGFPLAYEFGLKESPTRIPITVRPGSVVFDGLPPGTYTIGRVCTIVGPELAGGVS